MRGAKTDSNVTDVSDAQQRTVKGKLPRNIVVALGTIAAVLVGALGYYFQSISEAQHDEKAEQERAEQIRARAGSSEGAQNLEQTIRDQAERARQEAERQRKQATPVDTGKTPLLTASDLTAGAKAAPAPDAKQNEKDSIFTAPIYKSGVRKSQLEGKGGTVPDVTDPAQMRASAAGGGARQRGGRSRFARPGRGRAGSLGGQAIPSGRGCHDDAANEFRWQAAALHVEPRIRYPGYVRWRSQFRQAGRVPSERLAGRLRHGQG